MRFIDGHCVCNILHSLSVTKPHGAIPRPAHLDTTELTKKVCPRLRDLATAPAGGITQPRTHFFGQLCREAASESRVVMSNPKKKPLKHRLIHPKSGKERGGRAVMNWLEI